MINIISRSLLNPHARALNTVSTNLVKGLQQINVDFVINRDLRYCKNIWIHDDYRAINSIPKKGHNVVLGPNLFIFPRNIPKLISIPRNSIYLQPSEWVANNWRNIGYSRTKIECWFSGIDVDSYCSNNNEKEDYVLVYYKHRDKNNKNGLNKILNDLKKLNIKYKVLEYGNYNQNYFLDIANKAKYVVWYGRHESQGLALQECLGLNTPILVIDVNTIGDNDGGGYKFNNFEKTLYATSAPYFNNQCGILIKNIDDFLDSLKNMETNYRNFHPRTFVEKNLSISKSAEMLISIFKKEWGEIDDNINPKYDKKISYKFYWPLVAMEFRLRAMDIIKGSNIYN